MILLTGGHGFVGSHLAERYPDFVLAPSLRMMNEEDIAELLANDNIEVIIHTAAIADTGVCEKDPVASYRANVLLPFWLAKATGNKKLICFSSDQVYNGCKEMGPFKEEQACPASVYACHKKEMEERVSMVLPSAVILRAEWMYDYGSYKSNYFKLLMEADEVAFSSWQYRGLTYVREVVDNMPKLFKLPGGIYNFGSETSISMYEVSQYFKQQIRNELVVKEGQSRPNLWMDCRKIRAYGIDFADVCEGLRLCARDHHLL